MDINPNAKLWIIGDGPQRKALEARIASLDIESRVVLFGARSDVHRLMQGMDVLVLPSKYEGFGLVVLEGQAAGLPCVVSDQVPNDVDVVADAVQHCSLLADRHEWAKVIAGCIGYRNRDGWLDVIQAGFDINSAAKELENVYRECSKESSK